MTVADLQESPSRYRLVWAIAIFGILLRSLHYFRNPALWHDEAATILNIIRQGFVGLLGPLYLSGTGPPLFLWIQKCAVLCLGDSLYALRLVSFLASCAALLVMTVLAGRLLKPLAATGSVLLVACSDRLLWHAAEARHYSSDVLIASGLALVFVATRNKWTLQKRAFWFACAAPFVILTSYPGVFLLGGAAIALAFDHVRDKQPTAVGWLALIGLGVSIAGTFLVLFFTTASAQRTPALDAAWVHAFPDWRHPLGVPFWFIRSSVGVVDYLTRPIGGVLAVVACIGAVSRWRADRGLVLFLVAPLGLAGMAGLIDAYPYTGARTMVFAMPAISLLIGFGIQRASEWMGNSQPRAWLASGIIAVPILATLLWSIYRIWIPWPRANTSGAAAYVLEHRAKAEPVTANHWEYEYYFRGIDGSFYPDLDLLREKKLPQRYWVVLTSSDPAFATTVANHLPSGRVLERKEFSRTTVMLVATTPASQ